MNDKEGKSTMLRDGLYILFGYLSGSVLYARLFGEWIAKKDITEESRDGNPGTSNAFLYGGFWCGMLTLCCDLLKGFLPVWLWLRYAPGAVDRLTLSFVMAAPVIGHAYPVFSRFNGGKGIAASFGCLLGLLPLWWQPLAALAAAFLFFSLILRVSPHYHRTFLTYLVVMVAMMVFRIPAPVKFGFALHALTVGVKLVTSTEEKEKCEVKLLWRH